MKKFKTVSTIAIIILVIVGTSQEFLKRHIKISGVKTLRETLTDNIYIPVTIVTENADSLRKLGYNLVEMPDSTYHCFINTRDIPFFERTDLIKSISNFVFPEETP